MAATAKSLTGSDQAVAAAHTRLYGWSVRNTHATDAGSVAIYNDPDSANGTILGVISLAAGASSTVWFGPQGVLADLGVYVDIPTAGTWSGTIYTG